MLGELDGEYEPSALATLPDRLWTNMRVRSEQPNGSELAMGAIVWTPIVTLSIPPPQRRGHLNQKLVKQGWCWPMAVLDPKGTNLSGYTQRELNAIAHRLNTRPRKCLNFATPLEVYAHRAIIHPLHLELETARI